MEVRRYLDFFLKLYGVRLGFLYPGSIPLEEVYEVV
jgi:hypothetical protein